MIAHSFSEIPVPVRDREDPARDKELEKLNEELAKPHLARRLKEGDTTPEALCRAFCELRRMNPSLTADHFLRGGR